MTALQLDTKRKHAHTAHGNDGKKTALTRVNLAVSCAEQGTSRVRRKQPAIDCLRATPKLESTSCLSTSTSPLRTVRATQYVHHYARLQSLPRIHAYSLPHAAHCGAAQYNLQPALPPQTATPTHLREDVVERARLLLVVLIKAIVHKVLCPHRLAVAVLATLPRLRSAGASPR